jgi:SAM-dependent methyltransferase
MHSAWTVARDGVMIYVDSPQHVALILRTLRIDETRWHRTIDEYAARWQAPLRASVADRLCALREAYATATPPGEGVLSVGGSTVLCPACDEVAIRPTFARHLAGAIAGAPDRGGKVSFVYGRCATCGHGILLEGHTSDDVYAAPAYYRTQGADGVGYSGYAGEREYREAKGERLLRWVLGKLKCLGAPSPRTLLEVGSGFGFTRHGAESLGLLTLGVDLNPFAAEAARRAYGMDTAVGTLGASLDSGLVASGAWDLVLYNFVLEHVPDPLVELCHAVRAMHPLGALVLVVPSMDAAELDVFGGSYRSFRSDHLHIFSRHSIGRYLERAGLVSTELATECNAHLLRGFFAEHELRGIYDRGEGPDMTIIARRR